MLGTLINIFDMEYLFTYLSAATFPHYLFSLLRECSLFPCLSLSLVHLILCIFTLDK